MPRRKPVSAKQRKAELQLKRAIKRGDVPAPEPSNQPRNRRGARGRGRPPQDGAAPSSRRLQSSYFKLSAEYLEETKHLASVIPLPRPLSQESAIFSESIVDRDDGSATCGQLTVPKRPKWRFDMEKKEVESNEEGIFKKWLVETKTMLDKWMDIGKQPNPELPETTEMPVPIEPQIPPSPTHFEQNLEVWRQLWRVTEISQILMVLLDSRCPLIHFPVSLQTYLSNLRPQHKIILILTKVDVSGPHATSLWTDYLHKKFPETRIVCVESYKERVVAAGQGKKKFLDPHLPAQFRTQLVQAIKGAHQELCTPPPRVQEDPEKLKSWKPITKSVINWDDLLAMDDNRVGKEVGGALVNKPVDPDVEEELSEDLLTIGLIGQPNVGKSSLLNALFGERKVKASRTPGKTKHFQTLFWTPEVRLVDCPGLVMPGYVGMEMQVLAGILPIAQVPSIAACIYLASTLLPLETVFHLQHPSLSEEKVEDKRTWREGTKPPPPREVQTRWTAMDILSAHAAAKHWVTAKAGRLDVNRAGNHMLRCLAEAKVKWAFYPPGTEPEKVVSPPGNGIWIPEGDDMEFSDVGSEDDELSDVVEDEGQNESEEESDNESAEEGVAALSLETRRGKFDLLADDDEDE